MSDLLTDFPVDLLPGPERDRLLAACELIGRMGARSLEFGYANTGATGMRDAQWWAKVIFRGTMVSTEQHMSPVDAVWALGMRLLDGATCKRCGQRIREGGCTWRQEGPSFVPGCTRASKQLAKPNP